MRSRMVTNGNIEDKAFSAARPPPNGDGNGSESALIFTGEALLSNLSEHMRGMHAEAAKLRSENERLASMLQRDSVASAHPERVPNVVVENGTNGDAKHIKAQVEPPMKDIELNRDVQHKLKDPWLQGENVNNKHQDFGKAKEEHPQQSMESVPSHIEKDENDKSPSGTFADAANMKKMVVQALVKVEYDVRNYYKRTGIFQQIARSNHFENFTLVIITINAMWMAVDVDLNTASTILEAEYIFQIVEHSFCVYFTSELLIRLMSFQRKADCVRDAWFVFDAFLVTLMVFETWIMTVVLIFIGAGNGASLSDVSILRIMRMLRLTRMARMVKLLRAMPELMILCKGIKVAIPPVFFTLLLLVIIIYVFAVGLRQLTDGTELGLEYFPTVEDSMITLLLKATVPDFAEVVYDCGSHSVYLAAIVLVFILLASLTIMNMLLGILVEVVTVVASVEKEQIVVGYVKNHMLRMLNCDPSDAETRRITKLEFQGMLAKGEASKVLAQVGVDVISLMDLTDFVYKEKHDIGFASFMEMVLQFRGSNSATVKDIVDLRKFIDTNLTALLNTILAERLKVRSDMNDDMKAQVAFKSSDSLADDAVHCPSAFRAEAAVQAQLTLQDSGLHDVPVPLPEPRASLIPPPPPPVPYSTQGFGGSNKGAQPLNGRSYTAPSSLEMVTEGHMYFDGKKIHGMQPHHKEGSQSEVVSSEPAIAQSLEELQRGTQEVVFLSGAADSSPSAQLPFSVPQLGMPAFPHAMWDREHSGVRSQGERPPPPPDQQRAPAPPATPATPPLLH